MDLMSNLPRHILYDILLRMPNEDANRTVILSKTWKETWYTSPILILVEPRLGIRKSILDQKDLQEMEDRITERNNFLNHVDSTLHRYHDEGLVIKHFKLYLYFPDPHTMYPLIDYWLELASVSGLEFLNFAPYRPDPSLDERYCLPPNILECKSLVTLVLEGCLRVDKAFMNHPIKFCSLKELSLEEVYVGEEQVLQNLISSCPLIEWMSLLDCSGLQCVSIRNLPKLQLFQLKGPQKVDVDAPSLEHFRYFTEDDNALLLELDKCRNLRDLCLQFPRNLILTNQWFLETFHEFPLLEKLELTNCSISRKIHIFSMQLKVLKLIGCDGLEEACIDAPNLYSCSYHGFSHLAMPNMSFSKSSSCLEFEVTFEIGRQLDFLKLRNFLQNIKPTNVLASLVLHLNYRTDEFNPVLQSLSVPPPGIKRLHLQFFSETESIYLPLLLGLLWSCRPSIISIKLDSALCSRILVKLLCAMLMGKLKEDQCICNSGDIEHSWNWLGGSGQIRCWWHDLKDIEVTSSSKYKNVVIDCKTLLDALPTLSAKEVIILTLES